MTIDDEGVAQQTRRKVFLELLSLVVPVASAVAFSGGFIAGWSPAVNLTTTVISGSALGGCWVAYRRSHPADIAPPPPAEDESQDHEDDDDGGGWWDPFTILLFLVSLVAVIVIGVVSRFVLPLLVIVLIAVASSGSDLGDAARAVLAMLGVSFVLELAVVLPLARLWNLDVDAEPRPREEFCPRPSS